MRKKKLLAFALACSMVVPNGAYVFAETATDQSVSVTTTGDAVVKNDDSTKLSDSEKNNHYKLGEAYDGELKDGAFTKLTAESHPYSDKLKEYADKGYKSAPQDTEIVLDINQAKGENPFQYQDGSMTLKGEEKNVKGIEFFKTNDEKNCPYVEWTFDVSEEGLYEMYADLMPIKSFGSIIQRKIEIDGEMQFDELYNVYFTRHFEEEGKVIENAIGNEVWPKHVEKEVWQQEAVVDNKGYYTDPLQFYFAPGTHTVKFYYVDQDVVLGNVYLKGSIEYPTYDEYIKKYADKKPGSKGVTIQAENATWKTDSTIRRDTDTDPKTQSSDGSLNSATSQKLNTIGGSRWEMGNQSVSWNVDVPEDGLYTINARGQQDDNPGMPSYRQILIDGEIPFEEMKLYPYEYQEGWSAFTLSEHGEKGKVKDPYQFYLTKGKHELTMVVKSGSVYEIVAQTKVAISSISEIYIDITKVIGTNPDPNVEYNLKNELPELKDRFNAIGDELQKCSDLLAEISNSKTNMESNYDGLVSMMRNFADNPDLVVTKLSDLEDAQTSLGDYILTMGDMPLTFDYITLLPAGKEFSIETSNTLERLWCSVLNFFSSFVKNYDAVGSIAGDGKDGKLLSVWIARGREWGEVLKSLADESFTKETNIAVNLNILPSGQLNAGNVSALMLSITSHKAPDVALGVSFSDPVEFAFRDATVDLTKFDDFDSYVDGQFYDTMFVPYKYEKDGHVGIYALPETMDFTVLMYRTDIFDSLSLEVPKTWDDLWETTLPELNKNSMSFSFPVDTSASSNSPSSLKGMTMYLIQNGGAYYRDTKEVEGKIDITQSCEGLYTNIDSPEGFKSFEQWTDMYVDYGIDAESNFFTRFRTGIQPIGVGSYNAYMQILTQAPELYGRWSIAPMLGTAVKNEQTGETEVDSRVGGISLTACQLMSQSKQQDEGWKFLKWWMDKQTQIQYGREIEATMGIAARWNTANKQAFYSLPWDEKDIEVISEQMDKAVEQPIVLGGYFTTRHLVNAWTRVYMNNENPRDALEEAVKDINKELRTKHEEYGFSYDED